ncbi:MAG TPA: prephenate dehydratase [Candidatus Limnocylindria bacterium]|nr:prephenate dehydratase [Candidatus Limnocylindria bacterium]
MTALRVAFQGVAGAYSESAAAALFPSATLLPHASFDAAFAALRDAAADAAVVPVENSYAGPVADVFDLLRGDERIRVLAEALVRVRHCLLGPPGATLGGVRAARSHPQALAQSDAFLRERGIRAEIAFDTAGAAAEVAERGDPAIAAIASRRAAERYGLTVLAEDIESAADNITRFLAVARDAAHAAGVPAALRAGPPKTSLAFTALNVPGALVRALQPFATAGVQLSRIESRPSRVAAWDYVFYVDFEGDPAVAPAAEALALMRHACAWVQVIGTYPAATTVIDP